MHARVKHIEIDMHERIEIRYISIHEHVADVFTKPLGSTRFIYLRSKLHIEKFKINSKKKKVL